MPPVGVGSRASEGPGPGGAEVRADTPGEEKPIIAARALAKPQSKWIIVYWRLIPPLGL